MRSPSTVAAGRLQGRRKGGAWCLVPAVCASREKVNW